MFSTSSLILYVSHFCLDSENVPSFRSESALSLGQWHTIEVSRTARLAVIKVSTWNTSQKIFIFNIPRRRTTMTKTRAKACLKINKMEMEMIKTGDGALLRHRRKKKNGRKTWRWQWEMSEAKETTHGHQTIEQQNNWRNYMRESRAANGRFSLMPFHLNQIG